MRSSSGVGAGERLRISARRSLGGGKFAQKGKSIYNQIVLSLGTLCAPELRLEQELVNAEYALHRKRQLQHLEQQDRRRYRADGKP